MQTLEGHKAIYRICKNDLERARRSIEKEHTTRVGNRIIWHDVYSPEHKTMILTNAEARLQKARKALKKFIKRAKV